MPVLPRSHFLKAFCARVKSARIAGGMTQAEIAAALRIGESAYSKYEKRTPLPHHLIEPFAAAVGASVDYLVTGRRPAAGSPRILEDQSESLGR